MSTADNGADGLEDFLARAGAAAEAVPPDCLWHEGKEVGEWTAAGFIARGGSSEVYCARHRRLGTAAVLKVLRKDGAGPRERFDRETCFLMESPGPSFPAFFGAGVEEGRPWVAMELLEEYPLPSSDGAVAAYLLDVAGGVAELHRRSWVHRDLKPRNILRRPSDGHAVLADFGLLKRAGESAAAETAAGRESPSVVGGREVGVGTPGYAAPEQFAGGEATPATDVHALGILADECFGGKPPRAWERIVRRATASLPRQRYADAARFARAVRRRHWRRNAVGAVVAALGLALLATAVWKPRPRAVPPEAMVREAEEARTTASGTEPVAGAETGERVKGVRAMRAAALARFEAEEWRKEAVWALVDDMRKNVPGRKSMMGPPTWSGMHEVTQKQWTALMDENPSRFRGDDLPVDSLTFGACLEFLERLNATSVAKSEDLKFRLPAAWEWEEVAERMPAGTPEERLAAGWFAENAGGCTHPVGEKAEDGYRCDLFGNVRELTYTWGRADGKEGLLCLGGSWADSAQEEGIPVSVLEQPRFVRRHLERFGHAAPGADTMPSDYPHAVCPAPGQIGLRLWAERRIPPADDLQEALEAAVTHWENEEREESRQ